MYACSVCRSTDIIVDIRPTVDIMHGPKSHTLLCLQHAAQLASAMPGAHGPAQMQSGDQVLLTTPSISKKQ